MELVQLIILHACNILEINFPFQWIPSVLSGKFSLKIMVIMKSENKSNTPAINNQLYLLKMSSTFTGTTRMFSVPQIIQQNASYHAAQGSIGRQDVQYSLE